jgi:ubiquinone/menaquinone biosynthesis C-methylase UbiE
MTMIQDPEGNETKRLLAYADFAGRRVLEVGCGDGRLTWKYAGPARSVAAVDLEAQDLRLATVDRPHDLATRLFFVRADSIQLPFAGEKFDRAVLAWSL